MSRTARPFSVVAAAVLVAACHTRLVPQGHDAPTPAVAPRDVEVRAVSRAVGAGVVIAEIDRRHVAIVADEEESAIQVVDLDTRSVVGSRKLEGSPGQMVLDAGGTLFVAVRGAARVVALRFRAGGRIDEVARHETGEEPFGVAITPDSKTLLVTTIASARLERYRTTDLAPSSTTRLPRDPRSIAITPDGLRAFVSHATGSVLSVVDVRDAGGARGVSLDARERRRDFGMVPVSKPSPLRHAFKGKRAAVQVTMKRSATQGFALAMVGEKVFLPEALVMTTDSSEMIPTGYGAIVQSTLGTHVPFIAQAHVGDEKIENDEFSGADDRVCFEAQPECILPRSIADDGRNVYVACLDSNELLAVDPSADAEHAPACKKTLKDRGRVQVESPTDVAFDGDRKSAVVFSSFTRKLSVVEGTKTVTSVVDLPRTTPISELVAEGRALFHRSAEPRIAKNGRACASCHVDGRDDALVWPTPLGKRQTPMLAGRLEGTAPYGWNGEHASLVLHIESTLRNLEGTGAGDRELEALAAYVVSMRAPPRRAPAGKEGSPARGRAVFASNETGCSSCHTESTQFTDHETHALGNSLQATPFDTPSLAFVGQTAPYFHDGRFKTLEELIDGCDGIMGNTKHLSPESREDLVAYLRTL